MIEQIVIFILFTASVYYLYTLFKRSFSTKENGCAKGCGGCKIDVDKIDGR